MFHSAPSARLYAGGLWPGYELKTALVYFPPGGNVEHEGRMRPQHRAHPFYHRLVQLENRLRRFSSCTCGIMSCPRSLEVTALRRQPRCFTPMFSRFALLVMLFALALPGAGGVALSAAPGRLPGAQAGRDDPVAPRSAPAGVSTGSRFYAETGHYVSGQFLAFYDGMPNAQDLFGLPLTEEFQQRIDGRSWSVQYFERARLEWHPELAQGAAVQLGILGPAMLNGRTIARLPVLASTAKRVYFPETGHTLAYGFLNYWKAKGGLGVFGFPISEELNEDGMTVQYFERARFEYHSKLAGTPYAVRLTPLGYLALKAGHFNIPMGTLVSFEPPRLAEGHTTTVQVATTAGVSVTGLYEGRALLFHQEPNRGVAWALLGAVPFQDTGQHTVTIDFRSGDGAQRTVTRTLEVSSYPFPSESLQFDPQTAALLDPKFTTPELDTLDAIFAGRTPTQYWDGAFRLPLDGKVRITSYFATRRCYNCPPGGTPTSYHGGMDMAAALGTPVHAPADGRVVFAGKLEVRGNAI